MNIENAKSLFQKTCYLFSGKTSQMKAMISIDVGSLNECERMVFWELLRKTDIWVHPTAIISKNPIETIGKHYNEKVIDHIINTCNIEDDSKNED